MNPYQVLGVSQTDDEDIIKRHTEKRQKNATPILIREIKEQRNGLRKSERRTGFSVINKKEKSMMPEQHRENGKVRQADTVPKQAEGAPEDRFIREISKRNLNGFFPKECRARRRKTVHSKK